MPLPLVSVVIPVYNGEKHLAATLDSVFAQSYQPVEVIAVDDGSTDGSAGLLASYGSRLTVLRQANAGVSVARNTGIRAARGDFLALLDQDDCWLPDKLTRQVDRFLADPDLGLVHTDVTCYHEGTQCVVAGFARPGAAQLTGRCYDRLLLGNDIVQSSVMLRRSTLDRVGLFDTEQVRGNTVQDYDLWMRLARVSSFSYVPEKLTVYRLHPQQGTWNARPFLTEQLRLVERVLDTPDAGLAPHLKIRLAGLLESLAVAHLDAGEHALARQYLSRQLALAPSRRARLLWLASFVPAHVLTLLRELRAGWQRRRGTTHPWARPVEQPASPVSHAA